MKEIHLSNGAVSLVDDDDFDRVSKFKWHCTSTGYAARTIYTPPKEEGEPAKFTTQKMARFIMGNPEGLDVDHRSMNRLDNRKENLRVATRSQNSCNRGAPRSNTSGHKGVSWNKQKGKWNAQIRLDGKIYGLGRFATKTEAAEAYINAASRLHGEFARV